MMSYYSNGKLIILGEYYVLEGAKAFALPTKFGQSLEVSPIQSAVLLWKSFNADGIVWYDDEIAISDILANNQCSENKIRNTLIAILHQANQMNPAILTNGFSIETKLTFPRNWGLGTSSTLINNIAQWFEIDAFELLNRSFGGSGYDIACAQNNLPITYQIKDKHPIVNQVSFNPNFKDQLFFVYLNQKMDSKKAIANFKNKKQYLTTEINDVSALTDELLQVEEIDTFIALFKRYERDLSKVLQTPTIQEQFFSDFDGLVKSLGGWGGDFVLVASKENPSNYFKQKGFNTILTYEEMIL